MRDFIPNLDKGQSDMGLVGLLEKLPENTINIIEGSKEVPCSASLCGEIVCLGHASGIDKSSIIATVPKEATDYSIDRSGVSFDLDGQIYTIRCGHVYHEGHIHRVD